MSHPADNSGVLKAVDERVAYERVQIGAEMQTQIDQLAITVSDRDATIRDLRIANDVVTADLDAEREWRAEHMRVEHPAPGPTVDDLRAAWGVCVHANFNAAPAWENPDEWMAEAAAIGFTQIRSMFSPNNKGCVRTLALCRQYGIKWLMTLVPEDWSVTASGAASRIKWLHDNGWGDVVLGFEGPNEPDHERGGGDPPADWPQRTVTIVKAMKAARDQYHPGVPILSPSLHDVNQDRLNGDGYKKLAALGIGDLVDAVSLHSYPRGSEVLTGLEDRLALADIAYAGKPAWLSETGWTTYQKSGTGGHAATTEADAAVYGSEAPGIIAAHPRVAKAFRFELRDDPPAGTSTNSETRFGVVRPDKTWKPEATALQKVLAG